MDIRYQQSDAGKRLPCLREGTLNYRSKRSGNLLPEHYQRMVKRGDMTASVYKINGTNATLYTGAINRYLRGYVAIFKLRDKTVIMQTDAEIFKDDFFKVLDSVRFSA